MGMAQNDVPVGNLTGFFRHFKYDVLSGFLVFLIALPLCLGISLACGYPAIAGIFTAIIGSVLATFISNSELTIKGPAAGLIAIAIGCLTEFAGDTSQVTSEELPQVMHDAYRLALGVGVAAGVLQILFALLRCGAVSEFFPLSAVHGMLAAIGVIIIAKQVPIALGVGNKGEPLNLLKEIPEKIANMNPEIALISAISLLILFGLPLIRNKYVRMIPAPLIVVLVAVPLGMYFDLSHEHTYSFVNHEYKLGERYLVTVPDNMFTAITPPDFSGLLTGTGWKWVLMFALIGSLESLLSAKAIDTLDPWRRKSNMDRDLLAVGIGNTASALVGGLPMISEIVRSKANIDNGARTRFADMFHGLFLLAFVALVPWLIHRIPMAALAAMLVYTGFRLASPREFVHIWQTGKDQFVVFVVTMVAVLATDLLIGVAIGIGVQFLIHLINAVQPTALFTSNAQVERLSNTMHVVKVRRYAGFSNWILLRKLILSVREGDVVVDVSDCRLVDHTVAAKLHEQEREFEAMNRRLTVHGLHGHHSHTSHTPLADGGTSHNTNHDAGSSRLTAAASKSEVDISDGFKVGQ
jgi:MFS superfamily sulfate permease-like transporter